MLWLVLALAYVVCGIAASGFFWGNAEPYGDGSDVAAAFIIGIFWPIGAVALGAFYLWKGARYLGRKVG